MLYDDDPELEVFDLTDSQARRRTISKDREALGLDTSPTINDKKGRTGWGGKVEGGKSHEAPPSAAPSIYQQLVGLLLQDTNSDGEYPGHHVLLLCVLTVSIRDTTCCSCCAY